MVHDPGCARAADWGEAKHALALKLLPPLCIVGELFHKLQRALRLVDAAGAEALQQRSGLLMDLGQAGQSVGVVAQHTLHQRFVVGCCQHVLTLPR